MGEQVTESCSSDKMAEFNVRSVLVTGSNRGIGLGLVKRFLELPNPPEWIFATTREPDGPQSKDLAELASKFPNLVVLLLEPAVILFSEVQQLVTEEKDTLSFLTRTSVLSYGFPEDVTDPNSIKTAARRVEEHVQGHGLNLLMNNAGIARRTTMENENAETMVAVYATNTVGPLLVSQEFLPLLKKAAQQSTQKGLSCSKAAIINMSSLLGSLKLFSQWDQWQVPSYRCSKAALNMLTRCLASEYTDYGILTISLQPGWVKTSMGTEQAPQTVEETTQAILKMLPVLSEKENGSFMGWDGHRYPW